MENSYTECITRFINNLIHSVAYDIAVTNSQNTSCFRLTMDKPVPVEPFPGVHTQVESQVEETYQGQKDSNLLD